MREEDGPGLAQAKGLEIGPKLKRQRDRSPEVGRRGGRDDANVVRARENDQDYITLHASLFFLQADAKSTVEECGRHMRSATRARMTRPPSQWPDKAKPSAAVFR